MTIAERKAREAYDRENPWRPMSEAKPDGTVCELLFCDLVGSFDADPGLNGIYARVAFHTPI